MSANDLTATAAIALLPVRRQGAARGGQGPRPVRRSHHRRAREAGVYVHGSPALVNLLMQVDLDSQIPPQLYVAVAELLVWLHRMEQPDPVPALPALS